MLGRVLPADIVVDDPRVSGRHALLRPHGDAIQVEDIGSSNGTFVRGERITGPSVLAPGDEMRVGDTTLRVEGKTTTVADQEPTHWSLSVRTGPDAGMEQVLHEGSLVIGRDGAADMRLTDSRVSTNHVRITLRGQVATVTDLDLSLIHI